MQILQKTNLVTLTFYKTIPINRIITRLLVRKTQKSTVPFFFKSKNIQKLGHTKCFSNRPFISRQDIIWKLNCKWRKSNIEIFVVQKIMVIDATPFLAFSAHILQVYFILYNNLKKIIPRSSKNIRSRLISIFIL